MKLSFHFPRNMGARILSFFRRHTNAVLLILFGAALACAGFVFFRYGYTDAFLYEPQVTFKRLKIKRKKLNILTERLNAKTEAKNTVAAKTFSNPFIKLPQETPQR